MNTSFLSTHWGYGLLAVLEILLAAGMVALGATTALVRDSDPNQPDFSKRPFSLAKSQLAFWSVVVIGSFIYLYFSAVIFPDIVINNTALWLLGISTGTTALSAAAGAVPAAGASAPAQAQAHKDFFTDILSDNQGMNVHRLQMLIWTVVLGCVFVSETIKTGKFPIFEEQYFWLMGISSATYIWLKRNET